eukprot:COSAG05_NODE_893_length_6708_cov_2.153427_6_plen_113_part_00
MEGIKLRHARVKKAADGNSMSRGSGVVAVGRPKKLRQRTRKLNEMVVELSLRCKLDRAQQASVAALLASFSASASPHISFALFQEIAKVRSMAALQCSPAQCSPAHDRTPAN